MAKALMGHLGTDHRYVSEIASLRARVRALETEVQKLRTSMNAADEAELAPAVATPVDLDSELLELRRATPALA